MSPRLLFPDTYETNAVRYGVFSLTNKESVFFVDGGNPALSTDEIINIVETKHIDTLMIRTMQIQLERKAIRKLSNFIKLINLQAGGFDNVDVREASLSGISVATVPVNTYATDEVAEFTFGLLLTAAKKIIENNSNVKAGRWRTEHGTDLLSLTGKTIGIVGFGDIGTRVARIAKAFSMRVVVTTAHPSLERQQQSGVKFTQLKKLLNDSDFIVLAVPLNSSTENMINCHTLELVKKNVVIVNMCRGKVVNEDDIADALNSQKILSYCTDVFSQEPPTTTNPLLGCKNVVLSPHIAWKTRETVKDSFKVWFDNVSFFWSGCPKNIINLETIK